MGTSSDNWERVRRLRYGHVLKLILARYGTAGVPDDDAGRPDLMELLYLASQAPHAWQKKVANLLDLYAPWMQADERERLIEYLGFIPDYEKAKTSEELGRILELSNDERERLKLWSIRTNDLTAEEFADQSKRRETSAERKRDASRELEPVPSILLSAAADPNPGKLRASPNAPTNVGFNRVVRCVRTCRAVSPKQ